MLCMGDCAINISYEDKLDKEGNVKLTAAAQLAEVAVATANTAIVFLSNRYSVFSPSVSIASDTEPHKAINTGHRDQVFIFCQRISIQYFRNIYRMQKHNGKTRTDPHERKRCILFLCITRRVLHPLYIPGYHPVPLQHFPAQVLPWAPVLP